MPLALGRMTSAGGASYTYDVLDRVAKISEGQNGDRFLYYKGDKVVFQHTGSRVNITNPIKYLIGAPGRVEGEVRGSALYYGDMYSYAVSGLGDVVNSYSFDSCPGTTDKNGYFDVPNHALLGVSEPTSSYGALLGSAAANAPAYGYHGYFYDTASEFYMVGARWYDPS